MHAIERPFYKNNFAYTTCVASIGDLATRNRLTNVAPEIGKASVIYEGLANQGELYRIVPCPFGDKEVLIGDATKGELKALYDNQMLPKYKPARTIYDEIRAAAPHGKCPTCGIGQVNTLDHFLPKAQFPWFSVLPDNLIPACRDCNTGKLNKFDREIQNLHPYFDFSLLMSQQWIYARAIKEEPILLEYYIQCPPDWSRRDVARVTNHFKEYNLASRFSLEAASEIRPLLDSFRSPDMPPNQIRDILRRKIRSEEQHRKNFWRGPMYQALCAADWFCNLEI